jgi:hypothetical protein
MTTKNRTKSYSEKLRDPRWQKRRLEILSAVDFTCRRCNATEKELHVHHLIYRKGANPWEYADQEFAVLCADCHAIVEKAAERFGEEMARVCALLTNPDGIYEQLRGYLSMCLSENPSPNDASINFKIGRMCRKVGIAAKACVIDMEKKAESTP